MSNRPRVAVIDYGMGNLFSVERACEHAGLDAVITHEPDVVRSADAVVLPGVGAFASAMRVLDETGVSDAIRDTVERGTPFVGVCLGIQLLMTESTEFGSHPGLGIIPGKADRLSPQVNDPVPVKVPQMQWNRVKFQRDERDLLAGIDDGSYMYFVHSYYVIPDDPAVTLATTSYADVEFCSVLQRDNVFACQFHPERSGPTGLKLYENLAKRLGVAIIPEESP